MTGEHHGIQAASVVPRVQVLTAGEEKKGSLCERRTASTCCRLSLSVERSRSMMSSRQ